MDSGIYTAYSGLRAQSDALEVLANNLANINTTAFKEQKAFYTYLNQSANSSQPQNDFNATINQMVQTCSSLNLDEGSLSSTGRDLDIAIAGNGFLVVQTPNGIRYTRNGSLNMNAQSVLATSEGYPVLGVSGRAITLGPGKIRIAETGDVFLEDAQIDRLKVAAFGDLSVLEKQGNSLFKTRDGSITDKTSDAKIRAGYLEQSNVNPVSSIVRMIEIQRHFEAIQKSIHVVMNEINPKAIEKLGGR
ncbi:MAG: flagellar basal-body rod protein FlgF [Acidobacteria bacterium]|nr:flagellar basal-body rod protein FlgF [Acidobacteriota bacterium]